MLKLWQLVLILGLLALVSCDEDDDADDHDHEHFEASKWEFVSNGQVILAIENFQIISENTSINLTAGKESDHIDVVFYDENGDVSVPDEDEYSLAWVIGNENLLAVEQHAGEEGAFEFHLHAEAAGNTTIVFKVMHGDHSDASTPEIEVNITE